MANVAVPHQSASSLPPASTGLTAQPVASLGPTSQPVSTQTAALTYSAGTTASGFSLPAHCTAIQPQAGYTVLLCSPPPESFWAKALPSFPALGTSVLALLLSGYALYYNLTKDARARRQSVQDDFWLRKVVSPVSIEPFVKFTSELLVKLPDSSTPSDEREKFANEHLADYRALMVAFQVLELLSTPLNQGVCAQLEALEDRLAQYFGQLDAFAKGSTTNAPSRPEAIADLSALRLAVLEPIKVHQVALGASKEAQASKL